MALQYRVPALLAVGLEGFWGVVICAIALPILSVVKGSNGLPIDSFSGAFTVAPFLLSYLAIWMPESFLLLPIHQSWIRGFVCGSACIGQ